MNVEVGKKKQIEKPKDRLWLWRIMSGRSGSKNDTSH